MRILRTEDSRFRDLPDFPYPPQFTDVGTDTPLRLHYVDHGPAAAAPVVLLHGEHGWSYLYRHMIPPLAGAGLRVLAPDLIGFGKSDKPESQEDYSFEKHLNWLEKWLLSLDLNNITLVCQNRSSLLALALVMRQPERFRRIIAAEQDRAGRLRRALPRRPLQSRCTVLCPRPAATSQGPESSAPVAFPGRLAETVHYLFQ